MQATQSPCATSDGPRVASSTPAGVGHDRRRLAIGPFEKMNQPDRLARRDLGAQRQQGFVDARLGREAVVVAVERLHPARRRQLQLGARDLLAVEHAEVNQHVAQARLASADARPPRPARRRPSRW